MPLFPAHLAVPATTLLLFLLAASASAANFTCTEPSTCQSAIAYAVSNATTYEELISRFGTSTLQDLLNANNLPSDTAPKAAIPAETTLRIPFSCRCAGDGVGQSDGKPIYTVQKGENLHDNIVPKFEGFVTDLEIAAANKLVNASHIEAGWKLQIPLPCSCDKVEGSDGMHLAYKVVVGGESTFEIATKYNIEESTLLRVNNITGGSLRAGQILDVPVPLLPLTGAQPGSALIDATVVIGGYVAIPSVVVLVWFILSWSRWRRARDSISLGTNGVTRLDYRNLAQATKGFSKESMIGEGAFGTVYKGSLMDRNGMQQEMAVKKIKETRGKTSDFHAELQIISNTRHINLVRLEGWCCSIRWNLVDFMRWCRQPDVELFLVYELIPNGSLEYHLREKLLPWEDRYKILHGVGSALRYLHHECDKPILHRDIKPGNILLDSNFTAKLADFGLARVTGQKNTTLLTTAIGTRAYMDPECIRNGKVKFNRKSDVYSFGIVLLEVACGKSRQQVLEQYRPGQVVEAADEKLAGVFNTTQMERVIRLGLQCSHPDGKQRPYMVDVMKFLEDGIEFPAITEIEGEQGASAPAI